MSDLISRQAAEEALASWNISFNVLSPVPSVDAVEVVRCKDCRKREKINGITVCPIAWIKAEVSDDDFCSLGERK